MNFKKIPIVAFFIIIFMVIFFSVNPSYEKSIQAKYYYEIGDYSEAMRLAKEAFSLDVYNRMSSTIMAQSTIALQYVAYNNDAKKYMLKINEIATHDIISDADKATIRLMCGIMISAYVKLAPSVVTDKKLVQESSGYHSQFEKLLEKVNQ